MKPYPWTNFYIYNYLKKKQNTRLRIIWLELILNLCLG